MKKHLLSYGDFTDEEIATILLHFEEKTFKKRALILEAGLIERYQYFIVKGCVRGYITDYKGKQHNITFGFENFWFGDMESFIDNSKACYNYQALEDVTVLAISKKNWDLLSKEVPSFFFYTGILYRNSMIFQRGRIADHFMLNAEQRYHKLLEKHPNILQRISLKNIASYLGVTPEFISILRKKNASK